MSRSVRSQGLFDRPAVIRTIVIAIWVICGALLLADFFYAKHPHFGVDGWFGFYPVFGFVAYCAIVLGAKSLRPLLWRNEDYYDEDNLKPEDIDPGAPGHAEDSAHD